MCIKVNYAMFKGTDDKVLFSWGLSDLIYRDSRTRRSLSGQQSIILKCSRFIGVSHASECSLTAECGGAHNL